MKSQVFLFAAFAAVAAIADPPAATITDSTIADDVLTVTYTLANGPAVITFDILTNGASIGGEAVGSGVLYGSEVWMKVTGEGPHKIKWRVYAWNGNADISAVVTAWPLDNPPNYMVADISTKAHPNTQRYYPEADFVPGGVLGDTRYRKTALLMRKIMAKGITWTMGNNGSASPWREVTLTNNYYMGVFEVTQAQWAQVKEIIRQNSLCCLTVKCGPWNRLRMMRFAYLRAIRGAQIMNFQIRRMAALSLASCGRARASTLICRAKRSGNMPPMRGMTIPAGAMERPIRP